MYRFIEHTADMGIEARAPSCEDVFVEMARGLTALLYGGPAEAGDAVAALDADADEPVELLVAWLNEIVYRCESESLVPRSFRIAALDRCRVRATLVGERFDPRRHHLEHQVKSVTYHKAGLEPAGSGWTARVYVDL